MRLAFVDFIYHYDAGRPEKDEPLGGTTSAICFLARAMSAAGMTCTFFNRIPYMAVAHGISSFPLQALGEAVSNQDFDAYIFCGRWTAELVGLVRANTHAPLIGWMHESLFQDPMTPALKALDGIVYVSDWQMRVNQAEACPSWRQVVIRNAMNPEVARLAQSRPVLEGRTSPSVLLFAGSFARGAFHLPPILERIRKERTDFSVEMFCNLNPSRDAEKDRAYIDWLRSLPNIAHVGMVGQTTLAQHMRRASILLAPNPWPETSCIALIEGLASGLSAITTARAALKETGAGFAQQIAIDDTDHRTRFDMTIDYDAFASAALSAMEARDEERLGSQVNYFVANYQWHQRVEAWKTFILSFGPSSRV